MTCKHRNGRRNVRSLEVAAYMSKCRNTPFIHSHCDALRCKGRAYLVFLDLKLTVLPPSSVFWTPFTVSLAATAAFSRCTCSYKHKLSSYWDSTGLGRLPRFARDSALPARETRPAQRHETRHASELLTPPAIDGTEAAAGARHTLN